MVKVVKTIVEHGRVKDINLRDDLHFISDSQEVEEIKAQLGIEDLDYINSLFVKIDNGDYAEVYGISGIIPWLYKPVWLIEVKYQ